ncbi:MAG: toll/interleukin-1 receptor domain-containing protein [Pyrinomonadaceae bacterium]
MCLSYDEILNNLALPDDIRDLLNPSLQSLGYDLKSVTGHDMTGKPYQYFQAGNGNGGGGTHKARNIIFVENLQEKGCASTVMPLGFLFNNRTNPLMIFSKGEYVHPAYNEMAKMWKSMGPEDVKIFSSFEIGLIESVRNDPQESSLKVKEYMGLPGDLQAAQPAQPATKPALAAPDVVKVFVSYSHKDEQYLGEDSLFGYLSGLKQQGAEFWWDGEIPVGSKWDEVIKGRISQSHIAVLLISQSFLNSDYCRNEEVPKFLLEAETRGLIVFPVMLSPCAWNLHAWLKERQFIPAGKTIAQDFKDEGDRLGLFKNILDQLLAHIETIRGKNGPRVND